MFSLDQTSVVQRVAMPEERQEGKGGGEGEEGEGEGGRENLHNIHPFGSKI